MTYLPAIRFRQRLAAGYKLGQLAARLSGQAGPSIPASPGAPPVDPLSGRGAPHIRRRSA